MAVERTMLLKVSQVASLLGLSVSTVKRLSDDGILPAVRTAGRHRLYDPEVVLAYAREQGLPVGPIERYLAELQRVDWPLVQSGQQRVTPEMVDSFERALRRGRHDEAKALGYRVYEECGGGLALGDELIRPAMERVGDAWSVGDLDVFQEHRATRLVEHLLIDLNWRMQQVNARRGVRGPLAIGAAPEDDPYTLPGLLCELVLREQGWEVMNLGSNLPLGSLSRAVDAHRPRLAWLSVSHLENPRAFLEDYRRFYPTAERHGTAVILGGKALEAGLRAQLRCASFGERLAQLVDLARLLAPPPPSAADPANRAD
ncbi:MAG: hypothetical protein KatS3mg108_3556 [Isosphaeraceae bacterium]|jgi:excisionase family DNA binding protein|nr:MAG: hypothetical protein KatS3mg108_3556 [Isosphaeraceae bacterium]